MTKTSFEVNLEKNHVVGLDAVRFMAAALVMIYHLVFWRNGYLPAPGSNVHGLPWYGFVGVPVFFVLSGYVIAFSANNSTPVMFARNRVLRLAPVIWICATITLLITAVLTKSANAMLIHQYIRTLLLAPTGDYLDTVYWTLPIEVAFYLLILVLLSLRSFAAVVPVMIVVGIVSSAYNLTLILHANAPLTDFTNFWISAVVTLSKKVHTVKLILLEHGCFFSFGVLVWALQRNYTNKFYWTVASIIGIICFWDVQNVALKYLNNYGLVGALPLTPALVWLAAISIIIISIISNDRVLESSGEFKSSMRFLGLMTFPLYLLHNMNGFLIERFLVELGVSQIVALGLTALAIVFLSMVVVVWIEPLLRIKLKRYLLLIRFQ